MMTMVSVWSSWIDEQQGAGYLAEQPANAQPLRHWRL
jgi:hypothetical protein